MSDGGRGTAGGVSNTKGVISGGVGSGGGGGITFDVTRTSLKLFSIECCPAMTGIRTIASS